MVVGNAIQDPFTGPGATEWSFSVIPREISIRARNRRFWKWFRHRGRRQPGIGGEPFRWANGIAAPIPQVGGNGGANSVSADGTIIVGDDTSNWRLVSLICSTCGRP